MKNLTITAYGFLLCYAPGMGYLKAQRLIRPESLYRRDPYKTNPTQQNPVWSIANLGWPQSRTPAAFAGGWDYGEVNLRQLWNAKNKLLARWSTSNSGYDIWRYFGTLITLYPNEKVDYLFWVDRDWAEYDYKTLEEHTQPWFIWNTPRRLYISHKRKRARKIFVKPPSTMAQNWVPSSDLCQKPLFQYIACVCEMHEGYTADLGTTQDWWQADLNKETREPEWLEKWGHIPPPGYTYYWEVKPEGKPRAGGPENNEWFWTTNAINKHTTPGFEEITSSEKSTGQPSINLKGIGPKLNKDAQFIDGLARFIYLKGGQATIGDPSHTKWWSDFKAISGLAARGYRGISLTAVNKEITVGGKQQQGYMCRLIHKNECSDIYDKDEMQIKLVVKTPFWNAEYADPCRRCRWGPFCIKDRMIEGWSYPIDPEYTITSDICFKMKFFFQVGGENIPPLKQIDDPCAGGSTRNANQLGGLLRTAVEPFKSTAKCELRPEMYRRGDLTSTAIKYLTRETSPESEAGEIGERLRHLEFDRRSEKKAKKRKKEETSSSSTQTSSDDETDTEEETPKRRHRHHKRRRHYERKQLERYLYRLRQTQSEGDLPTSSPFP